MLLVIVAHLLGWLRQLGGQEAVDLSQLFHAVVVQILHHLEHGVHPQHIPLQDLHQSHGVTWGHWLLSQGMFTWATGCWGHVAMASCRTWRGHG